ncbi:MAG: hypothetical protein RMK18_11825 [Armatimonadota bacterium]|nr:hypothetical protein [Armatimonadota bacterium]
MPSKTGHGAWDTENGTWDKGHGTNWTPLRYRFVANYKHCRQGGS